MTAIPGVDYSWDHPGGAALAAAGKKFACRYMPWTGAPDSSKGAFLTQVEIADLHGHGLAIVATYERETTRSSTAGAAGGKADGTDARLAMAVFGFPAGCVCYVTIQDTTLTAGLYPAIATYLGAFRSALGTYRTGIYCGSVLREYLVAHGFLGLFWQSAALSWSSGRWDPTAAIQQRGTGNVAGTDADTALVTDFGQWAAPQLPETDTTGGDMVATHGGMQTGLVAAGTPYSLTAGGAARGTIPAAARYFLPVWSPDGKYVALDGLYLAAPSSALVACGWVAASAVTDIQSAVPTLSPYHIEVTTSSATVPIVTVTKS